MSAVLPGAAVLLDRDGTVIYERRYLSDPAGVELLPGAVEGLLALQRLGLPLVLVTNQAGVGRGYYGLSDMRAVQDRVVALLADAGVRLASVHACPHHPDDGCGCRKPATGMATAAAAALALEPGRCFVVGDKRCDVDLGLAWGATSLLVRTGYGREEEPLPDCRPHAVVDDLREAAHWIAARLPSRGGAVE